MKSDLLTEIRNRPAYELVSHRLGQAAHADGSPGISTNTRTCIEWLSKVMRYATGDTGVTTETLWVALVDQGYDVGDCRTYGLQVNANERVICALLHPLASTTAH